MEDMLSWMVLGAFTLLMAAIALPLGRFLLGSGENGHIPGPWGWPYIGILPTLLANKDWFHVTLQEWEKKYGKLYGFVLMGKRWYVTSDASIIAKVALNRPASYHRWRTLTSVAIEMGALGLFTVEEDTWVRHRKATAPAFSSFKVADMQASMASVVAHLMKLWDNASQSGQVVNAADDLLRFTLDVIGITSFGLNLNSINGSSKTSRDLQYFMYTLNERMFAVIPTWRYKFLETAADRKYKEVQKSLTDFFLAAKQQTSSTLQDESGRDNLMRRLLRHAEEDTKEKLSDEELVGNMLNFFLGGQDTTAVTLTWTLFFLATRSEIQEKVHEEMNRVFGSECNVSTEALAAVDTKKLKYLTMVIKESMRLKPVGTWLEFQAIKTTKVQEGFVLHPDDVILSLGVATAKSEKNFERPLEFDPSRWEGDTRGLGMASGAEGFGYGQRICPGRYLAFTEMQLTLAAICHRFLITLAPDCPPESVKERLQFSMGPSHLRLTLVQRRPQ